MPLVEVIEQTKADEDGTPNDETPIAVLTPQRQLSVMSLFD